MKTVGEFIQRVQVDPTFEKQAQAFDNGDEFIAFVKSEGYDFTLEQLMDEFKHGAELSAEAGGMAPAPTDAGAVTPWPPDDREFSPSLKPSPKAKKVRPWESLAATTLPGSHWGRSCRNHKRQHPRRARKKSRRQGCLGVAGAGTGGFPPRD